MQLPLALVLAVTVMGSACFTVQTRVTADVIVETAGGHTHYFYEATETHDTVGLAVACVATAIWYGGACWAYLAVPFDAQEATALRNAQLDVERIGACAHLLQPRIEASGWNTGGRWVRLTTIRGETVAIEDARGLCVGAVPPALVPLVPQTPLPSPASAPPQPWDPANP